MIPYGRQHITEADIEAVVAVLRSDFLTQGPAVPAFEQAVAAYCGARHAVAVNSATSALHIACLALGLGPGDWLWTSPNTFVASANCALYCGAQVDFVDIDPISYNMSVAELERKLKAASSEGRLPKIVIPVHFAGEPCDMAAIHALGQRYGFRVIEDASHAIGARYRGEPVGNCRYSDITVFSFHPVKIITTAEGGMAVTNDEALAARMARLRTHGITRDPVQMTGEPDGPWYYEQVELGFNYRMNDLQAALGVSQLQRVDDYIMARHAIAAYYDEAMTDLPLLLPQRDAKNCSALHLYVVLAKGPAERCALFDALRAQGLGVNVHYIPVYRQPYYAGGSGASERCPNAERYYERAVSLPLYPGLIRDQQRAVVAALRGHLLACA